MHIITTLLCFSPFFLVVIGLYHLVGWLTSMASRDWKFCVPSQGRNSGMSTRWIVKKVRRPSRDVSSHGSFHSHGGYPKIARWFLWTGKSQRSKWMTGGTPISGNHHRLFLFWEKWWCSTMLCHFRGITNSMIHRKSWNRIYNWWLPEMGVPPVIIHFERWIFPNKNHSFWGTTICGNLQMVIFKSYFWS